MEAIYEIHILHSNEYSLISLIPMYYINIAIGVKYCTLRNGVIEVEIASRSTRAALWADFAIESAESYEQLEVALSSARRKNHQVYSFICTCKIVNVKGQIKKFILSVTEKYSAVQK